MIPFGDKVVTLYHREDGSITRHALCGCSWRAKRTRTMVDGAAMIGDEIVCRYSEGRTAAVGDLFVLGTAEDTPASAIDFAGIIEKHPGEAFVCESFADYSHTGVIPHYCARGSG